MSQLSTVIKINQEKQHKNILIYIGGLISVDNDQYYLRGISSVTVTSQNEICELFQPVGFTDIGYFHSWIMENVDKI